MENIDMETVLQELYDNSLEVVKRLLKENESLRQQLAEWETLKDANSLYVNLLSGRPAQLSIDHKKGLLGQQLAEQTSAKPVAYRYRYWDGAVWNLGLNPTLEVDETWLRNEYPNFEIEPLFPAPPSVEVLLEALRKVQHNLEKCEVSRDTMQIIREALAPYKPTEG
jgi:hypothetical protein